MWQKAYFCYREPNIPETKFIITVVHHTHSQKHSRIKGSFTFQSFMDKLWSSYRVNVVRITEQWRLDRTSAGLQYNSPVKAGTASNLDLPDQRTHPGKLWKSPSTEIQQLHCLTIVIVTSLSAGFLTAARDLVLTSLPSSTHLRQSFSLPVHCSCSYNLSRTCVKRRKSTTSNQVTYNTISIVWARES